MLGILIPAYQASASLRGVLVALKQALDQRGLTATILVVDDGSTDGTGEIARDAGATVVTHAENRGKGAALETGLLWYRARGADSVVTLDADGQHPAHEAVSLLTLDDAEGALVLGVRDLARAQAPRANQCSNRFSNLVLSLFGGRKLQDTQCGLRRYPIAKTLGLGSRRKGFAFESDVVLRAARTGLRIVHVPVEVLYPPLGERVTHFDSIRDPARIVGTVVMTTLLVPHHRPLRRWGRRLILLMLATSAALWTGHAAVSWLGRMDPPEIDVRRLPLTQEGEMRRVGSSQAIRRNGIWEVFLKGDPQSIGWAHATLLRDRMVANERVLSEALSSSVPQPWARTLVLDLAQFSYRGIDESLSEARRSELAAQALAFVPDPFQGTFPSYQRFVYLNALYDIALSFEHSPLIGCTTFTVSAERSATGGPLLARNFDFEVDDIFDQDKAVFFVEEEGKLPFASVAWPGLVGVLSGLNIAGLGIVVHGARGGPTTTQGVPVVHALRRVLGEARSAEEAVRLLDEQPALVSHLVIVQDQSSAALVVERSVGRPGHVRRLAPVAAVTNHFEGPLAADPKNLRVLRTTSTRERRARADTLVDAATAQITPQDAVAWLRDKQAADGSALPPGDRRAIDAEIATHGVVMDTRAHQLWVSRSPHLSGGFVSYHLDEVFARAGLAPASRATGPDSSH